MHITTEMEAWSQALTPRPYHDLVETLVTDTWLRFAIANGCMHALSYETKLHRRPWRIWLHQRAEC